MASPEFHGSLSDGQLKFQKEFQKPATTMLAKNLFRTYLEVNSSWINWGQTLGAD